MGELVLGEASIQENFLQDKKEMGDASKTGTTSFSENVSFVSRSRCWIDIQEGRQDARFGGSSCDLGTINTGDACVGNVDGKVRVKTLAFSILLPVSQEKARSVLPDRHYYPKVNLCVLKHLYIASLIC